MKPDLLNFVYVLMSLIIVNAPSDALSDNGTEEFTGAGDENGDLEYQGPSYEPTGHYHSSGSRCHPCGTSKVSYYNNNADIQY